MTPQILKLPLKSGKLQSQHTPRWLRHYCDTCWQSPHWLRCAHHPSLPEQPTGPGGVLPDPFKITISLYQLVLNEPLRAVCCCHFYKACCGNLDILRWRMLSFKRSQLRSEMRKRVQCFTTIDMPGSVMSVCRAGCNWMLPRAQHQAGMEALLYEALLYEAVLILAILLGVHVALADVSLVAFIACLLDILMQETTVI